MVTVPSAAPAVLDRVHFALSPHGGYGACLAIGEGDAAAEQWAYDSPSAEPRRILRVAADRESCVLPLDDGRILLSRAADGRNSRHRVALVRPREGEAQVEEVGEVPGLPAGFLLPGPSPDQLGFAVTLDDTRLSTLWRLSPGRVEPVVRVPGALSGGVWLDADLLALNHTDGSRGSSGVVVDTTGGSWRRIWSISETSSDRILLYGPESRTLVVSSNASGEDRIGWALLGEQSVRFPEALRRLGHGRRALALDDRARRLLVHDERGATSRLSVYNLHDDRLLPLAGPSCTASTPASWTGDVIRLRVSTPSHPPTLATVRLDRWPEFEPQWSFGGDPDGERASRTAADIVQLEGPAGPIETIVYGGADWRRERKLAIALHGGPFSSWRFAFDPLFQALAGAGVAVVAPNYRGSTGYGDDHARAIIGDWGGPDLDDIVHIGRRIAEERRSLRLPEPVVLGASYGGFLALLAACTEPGLWSACVALAPFLSGRRLQASAADAVRDRTRRLGGVDQTNGAGRARDVWTACGSLAAPLLVAHGTRDANVPVEQSRTLRQRLLELGRREGVDFEYVEIDGTHAEVVHARPDLLRTRLVRFCLARQGNGELERSPAHSGRR